MASNGLLVGVYTQDKTLSIKFDIPSSVEEICKQCAQKLHICLSYIQLFSLFDLKKKIYLSPNHLFSPSILNEIKKDVNYMFQVRFHPEVRIRNKSFNCYLQFQYRHYFNSEFPVNDLDDSSLFSWGLWDMMVDSYEKKLTSKNNIFQSKHYKDFFPKQIEKRYNFFQEFLLKRNLKKSLLKLHENKKHNSIERLQNIYIQNIKELFGDHLNVETFAYNDKNKNTKQVKIQERNSNFMLCFEDESYILKYIRVVKIHKNFVDICLKDSSPKMLEMQPEILESFVSAIDGFYRLVYDHHYGICESVFSPRIKNLQSLGSYDFITEQTITDILKSKTESPGCFLMRMRLDDTETFDVFTIDSKTSNLLTFTVGPNEVFKTLESLQESHPFLQQKIIPTHFEYCDLFFGDRSTSLKETQRSILNETNHIYRNSEISFPQKSKLEPFHRGIFTEMYKGTLTSNKTEVSMKVLRYSPESQSGLQLFMEDIDNMYDMSKSCFLQMKGVILSPNFGMISELPLYSVVTYLFNKPLSLVHILKMALTVAEGLQFLKDEGIVHGDITCENLQLITVNTVKITDASIINKAYLLPKDNIIYQSRLPWLDPHLQKDPPIPTFESDIYSYGTLLCELLCFQCKPPVENLCNQSTRSTYKVPCRLLSNTAENEQSIERANIVREQLCELILKCRAYKTEDRPQPLDISAKLELLIHELDISANLEELSHESNIQNEVPTDSLTHSLCNHEWITPMIVKDDVLEALRIIKTASKKIKVPRRTPIYMIEESDLKKVKKIGKGAYGIVYLGIYTQPKGEKEVAIKVIPIKSNQHLIGSEIKILHQLKHDRIIDFFGFCSGMGIVMEYVKGGDLVSKLKSSKTLIPNLVNILFEITEGMEYLQDKKIIHRDLAARNVLLTEDNHVKITDFGLAKDYDEDYYTIKTFNFLPLLWCAPEMDKLNSKADVWSFGVVMWECYSCGAPPQYNKTFPNFKDYINRMKSGERLPKPDLCPDKMYKTMKECWNFERSQRPDFGDLKIILDPTC